MRVGVRISKDVSFLGGRDGQIIRKFQPGLSEAKRVSGPNPAGQDLAPGLITANFV
jgi:hypothetical protein